MSVIEFRSTDLINEKELSAPFQTSDNSFQVYLYGIFKMNYRISMLSNPPVSR